MRLKSNLTIFSLLLLVLLIGFYNKTSGQSRSETLAWLKEKINLYQKFSGTTFYADGILGNNIRDWTAVYDVDENDVLTIYEEYSGNENSGSDGKGYLDKYVVDLKRVYKLGINRLGSSGNYDLTSRYGILDYFNLITFSNEVEYTHLDRNDDSISVTHIRSCRLIILDSSEENFYVRTANALKNLVRENNLVNAHHESY